MAKKQKGLLISLLDALLEPPKTKKRNTPSRYKTVTGLNYGSRKKR